MSYERFYTAVSMMQKVCDDINMETTDDIEYVVLQGVSEDDPYARDPFLVQRITDFYNYNWRGNVDFMHIPNYYQVEVNCNSYPVIICREKSTKEILGISTIKIEKNSEKEVDPYYPFIGERYFSITGILTKEHNKYRGIGSKIYEIAIGGYLNYNREYNDTSLMTVIDCRNRCSLNAIYKASENISKRLDVHVRPSITGLYTVTVDDKMVEAPTLVINVISDLANGKERREISYLNTDNLYDTLLNSLGSNIGELVDPISNYDVGVGE